MLTKQWNRNGTIAYSIPDFPGDHIAKKLDGYQVEGLVAGAAYSPITKVLYLIGYTKVLRPFIFRVEGSTETSIFGGAVERTDLNIGFSQIEGIAHVDANTYFFSSELFRQNNSPIVLEPSLFSFESGDKNEGSQEESPTENSEISQETKKEKLILYHGLGSNTLKYKLTTESSIFGQAIFDMTGRRIHYVLGADLESDSIDLSTLKSSIYYLTFYLSDKIISKPFIKY